jgi:hypothetical protein
MSRAHQIRRSRRVVSRVVPKELPIYHRNSGLTNDGRRETVAIHRYDPAREVACQAVGMAYGQVYVGGCDEAVRSYEINTSGDSSGFLPTSQVALERASRVCG